jgi:hypothetical protein
MPYPGEFWMPDLREKHPEGRYEHPGMTNSELLSARLSI